MVYEFSLGGNAYVLANNWNINPLISLECNGETLLWIDKTQIKLTSSSQNSFFANTPDGQLEIITNSRWNSVDFKVRLVDEPDKSITLLISEDSRHKGLNIFERVRLYSISLRTPNKTIMSWFWFILDMSGIFLAFWLFYEKSYGVAIVTFILFFWDMLVISKERPKH